MRTNVPRSDYILDVMEENVHKSWKPIEIHRRLPPNCRAKAGSFLLTKTTLRNMQKRGQVFGRKIERENYYSIEPVQ